jgi:hypothetical protein
LVAQGAVAASAAVVIGCGTETECGDGACAALEANAVPASVRGTVPVRIHVTELGSSRWRITVSGPGGASCGSVTVERMTGRAVGGSAAARLTPRDFARQGDAPTWCQGRYTGVARRGEDRRPIAFEAVEPPQARIADRAARDFAALRRAPNQAFRETTRAALARSRALTDDSHLLGRLGELDVVVGPVAGRLCLFAIDNASSARQRVCRTLEQALHRETLSGRIRTPRGPVVFALLPDFNADVRIPTRPGGFRYRDSRPVRRVAGFVAVRIEGDRRPFYRSRDGLVLPIRY